MPEEIIIPESNLPGLGVWCCGGFTGKVGIGKLGFSCDRVAETVGDRRVCLVKRTRKNGFCLR